MAAQTTSSSAAITSVALTGATGFVGRTMIQALLDAGLSVRALVRDRDKARALLPNDTRVSLVMGDAADPQTAQDLLRGAGGPVGACINLVGIIREDRKRGQTFQRCHVDVPRVLVQECERLGVRRFLQMSALGVQDAGVSKYQLSKWEGETSVRLSSLDWTIFRPGMIHGADGEFIQMAQRWITGHEAPYFFLPYFQRGVEDQRVPLGGENLEDPRIAPVLVDDVARAFVGAINNPGTHGEVYNLVGPESFTWPQMLRAMRDATPGALPLNPFGLPANPIALVAKGAELAGLGGLLPFDEGMVRMGAQDATADITKAREDLAWKPRPFTTTYKQYAAALAH